MSTEITDSMAEEVFRDGDYWLAANGKIYRGEELIGTMDEAHGKVTYEAGMLRYKNRVGRLLNGYYDSPHKEPKEPVKAAETAKADVSELTLTQIMCDYPEGAPAYDWRGDMTPDFVEWYFVNYPERAKLRYARRRERQAVADYFNS